MIATRLRTAVALMVGLGAACHHAPETCPRPAVLIHAASGTATLDVAVADTPDSQARGLSGRDRLGADDGMLFRFDGTTTAPFWMKGTTIPLSVAFYDGSGRIIDIQDMDPCATARCPLHRSARPYVGAIEANQGYFGRHGIRPGDRVRPRIGGCT